MIYCFISTVYCLIGLLKKFDFYHLTMSCVKLSDVQSSPSYQQARVISSRPATCRDLSNGFEDYIYYFDTNTFMVTTLDVDGAIYTVVHGLDNSIGGVYDHNGTFLFQMGELSDALKAGPDEHPVNRWFKTDTQSRIDAATGATTEVSEKDTSEKDEEDEEVSEKDEEVSEKDEEVSEKDEEVSEKDEEVSDSDTASETEDQTMIELAQSLGISQFLFYLVLIYLMAVAPCLVIKYLQ
jgi:hypothetical protein